MGKTRLEIMRENQAHYANLQERIKTMTPGLERDVASTMTLNWIKGTNWIGGLNSAAESKSWKQLARLGYDVAEFDSPDVERILNEFDRQTELEWLGWE